MRPQEGSGCWDCANKARGVRGAQCELGLDRSQRSELRGIPIQPAASIHPISASQRQGQPALRHLYVLPAAHPFPAISLRGNRCLSVGSLNDNQ